jgi:hypothetical protein
VHYEEEFAAANSAATSDFERSALRDGDISRAEYEEAVQLYVECVQAEGVNIATEDQYGFYVYVTTGGDEATEQRAMDGCRAGTIEHIEPLYHALTTDPENRGGSVMVTECLQRKGFLPEDYDPADLPSDFENGFEGLFEMGDENAGMCFSNPML